MVAYVLILLLSLNCFLHLYISKFFGPLMSLPLLLVATAAGFPGLDDGGWGSRNSRPTTEAEVCGSLCYTISWGSGEGDEWGLDSGVRVHDFPCLTNPGASEEGAKVQPGNVLPWVGWAEVSLRF